MARWIPFKGVLQSVIDHDVVEKFSFIDGGDAAMDVVASKFIIVQGLANLMRQQTLKYTTFIEWFNNPKALKAKVKIPAKELILVTYTSFDKILYIKPDAVKDYSKHD